MNFLDNGRNSVQILMENFHDYEHYTSSHCTCFITNKIHSQTSVSRNTHIMDGKTFELKKPQYALSGGAIWKYATHFFGKYLRYETDSSIHSNCNHLLLFFITATNFTCNLTNS